MATKVKNSRLDKPADNTAYGPSRSGVTDQAPSKDAIYNKIESLSSQMLNIVGGTTYYAYDKGVISVSPNSTRYTYTTKTCVVPGTYRITVKDCGNAASGRAKKNGTVIIRGNTSGNHSIDISLIAGDVITFELMNDDHQYSDNMDGFSISYTFDSSSNFS